MCLGKLPEKDEKAALEELEDVFPCWKIVQKSGHCEYDQNELQPRIMRGRAYEAENHPARRMMLNYPPSFHAYLEKPVLTEGDVIRRRKIIKCWARKEDINRIGYSRCDHREILAVATSRIMRK